MPCGDLVVAAGTVYDGTPHGEGVPQTIAVWRLELCSASTDGHADVEECCAHLEELRSSDDVPHPKARPGLSSSSCGKRVSELVDSKGAMAVAHVLVSRFLQSPAPLTAAVSWFY